jgi:hypothetical protein
VFHRSACLMLFLALAATPPLAASDAPRLAALSPADRRLADAVAAITRADYHGDRAELEKQAKAVAAIPSEKTRVYREYWTGFAYWRRAINGFNETPRPADLLSDLDQCALHERSALALDPKSEDARSALVGCLVGQISLVTPEKKDEILKEAIPVMRTVIENSEGNPRSLWIVGGGQAFAPPPNGGHFDKATATYRRGLAAARAEALAADRRDPWVPSWGAPELLMSLAYLNTVGDAPNRELARAYAESALSMAPDWHYVKDILLPKIEEMPERPSEKPSAPK